MILLSWFGRYQIENRSIPSTHLANYFHLLSVSGEDTGVAKRGNSHGKEQGVWGFLWWASLSNHRCQSRKSWNKPFQKCHIPGISLQGRTPPGQSCVALSSTNFVVCSQSNSAHPHLIAGCFSCARYLLSSRTVTGTSILFWGLLTRRSWLFCSSHCRMTSCEHTHSTAAVSFWFIPYLNWSSVSMSVCLTKLSKTWDSVWGF